MVNRIANNQLFQLTLGNFKEKIREPAVIFWGIVFPILMSLGLGIAFTRKADTFRHVALISSDTGSYSITLEDDKLGDTEFRFKMMDWDEAMVQLKRGHVNVIIEQKDSVFNYHFDPMNPDAQLTYLKLSPLMGKEELPEQNSMVEINPLTVGGTRYIDFLVPGLITMGIMFSCLWGVTYNIIEARSKKLLRRMVATPMKKSNYLIALITVRIVMNIIEAGLLFLFVWLVFDITIQGSLPALFIIFLAGNIAFAGLGIFLASHTSKTEIGNAFINIVSMPMMVLSGIFFSYHNFPDWIIPFIKPLPLTTLTDGIRAIFIEGAGFAQTAIPSLILTVTGVVFFTVGLKIFKWH
ncbi:MAG: ABC transporter permease [Bacteroidales bacterium]|nr:ABC transporter permease [Bacteroidales bacterium]